MGIRYKIITTKFFVLLALSIVLVFFTTAPVLAQNQDQEPVGGESYDNYIRRVNPTNTGLGNAFDVSPGSPLNSTAVQGGGFNTDATFKTIIGKVITMVLELMGVMFLVLAIFGGFKWMTAGGNEESVEKAKKMIINATIGLIIVLAAYALTRFIVEVMGAMAFK